MKNLKNDKKYQYIINARKLTPGNIYELTLIKALSLRLNKSEDEIIKMIIALISILKGFSDKELFEKAINKNAIKFLEGIVSNDSLSYILIKNDGHSFKNKKIVKINYENTPIKVLDGTGNLKVVESFFRRNFEAINKSVPFNAKYIHFKKSINKILLLGKNRKQESEEILKPIIAAISAQKVLIISYKKVVNSLKKICGEIDPTKKYYTHYFSGPRGLNRFKECEAVIVVGLPYPNLTMNKQDAFRFFPDGDSSLRDTWSYICMHSELLQLIHRVRPIHKNSTEICIATKNFPEIFPDPDEVIDRSRDMNRKQRAIDRLEPFVKTFGFLNPDIALLAGVCVESNKKMSFDFRKNIKSKIDIFENNLVSCRDDVTCKFNIKLVYLLYIIYKEDYAKFSYLVYKIKELVNLNEFISLTKSNKAWRKILEYFQSKYPFLNEFTIKSENTYQHIKGIGNEYDIKNFYKFLFQFKIFNIYQINTLKIVNNHVTIIPENVMVFYFKNYFSESLHIFFRNEILTDLSEYLKKSIENKRNTIITNDYDLLIDIFINRNINHRKIYDICLNERIIRNGVPDSKDISTEQLFQEYGYNAENFRNELINIYLIFKKQRSRIESLKIIEVIELESKVLWITKNIQKRGITVDYEKLYNKWEKGTDTILIESLFNNIKNNKYYIPSVNTSSITGRIYYGLQNTPKRIRNCFISKEGYVFIKADYSQFEPRILSYISQDKRSMDVFNSDGDIYKTFATEISSDPSESREIAKQIIISLNNGSTEYGVHDALSEIGIEKSIDDVRNLITLFHNLFPKFKTFQNNTVEIAKREGFIKTPLGRIRYFNNFEDFKTQNSIKLTSIQGIASDGFKIALCNIDKKLRGIAGAEIIMTIHDEIIVEVKDSQELIDEVKRIMKECMESAFNSFLPNAVFKVEFDVVNHW